MVNNSTQTFSLPRHLKGRSIHLNVIPTVCNLKNMIEKMITVKGNHPVYVGFCRVMNQSCRALMSALVEIPSTK
jgi:hypothetical protein